VLDSEIEILRLPLEESAFFEDVEHDEHESASQSDAEREDPLPWEENARAGRGREEERGEEE